MKALSCQLSALSLGACKNKKKATKRHKKEQRRKTKGVLGLHVGARGSCPASWRLIFARGSAVSSKDSGFKFQVSSICCLHPSRITER